MLAEETSEQASYEIVRGTASLAIFLIGNWNGASHQELYSRVCRELSEHKIQELSFDTSSLKGTDTNLVNLLLKLKEKCDALNITFQPNGLNESLQRLIHLATAVPPREGAERVEKATPFVEMVGEGAIKLWKETKEVVSFIGESVIVLYKFFTGRARMRMSDLVVIIEECGPRALAIVTLISMLVGLILAFIGAVQFQRFGAELYVANLVGIAMTRELGAILAGVILAGRTGAAFAAELGTMQVNEEIDALSTFGISPMEFLVLPRMLALMLMMPLLCLYANIMGIIGGAIVSLSMLGITAELYWGQTIYSIQMSDFLLGVGKSVVFGVLVAVSGCMRGMQSGRSSAAVGLAATSAVVTGIVLIVVTDAIFAVVANVIGV